MTARLINTSADTLRGPFKVRALGVSSQLAEVVKATNASNGITGVGAVWDYAAAVPSGVLAPNAMSESRSLTFALEKWKPMFGDNEQRNLLVEIAAVVLARAAK
jgi:hypothetical protein